MQLSPFDRLSVGMGISTKFPTDACIPIGMIHRLHPRSISGHAGEQNGTKAADAMHALIAKEEVLSAHKRVGLRARMSSVGRYTSLSQLVCKVFG